MSMFSLKAIWFVVTLDAIVVRLTPDFPVILTPDLPQCPSYFMFLTSINLFLLTLADSILFENLLRKGLNCDFTY